MHNSNSIRCGQWQTDELSQFCGKLFGLQYETNESSWVSPGTGLTMEAMSFIVLIIARSSTAKNEKEKEKQS